jgi:hypothetical protein
MYVGIMDVQITFKWGFFLLAFKTFQAANDVQNFIMFEICDCGAQNECFLFCYDCWQMIMENALCLAHLW